jgi:6,7-dimethyl-8-ribityllumazine synthase
MSHTIPTRPEASPERAHITIVASRYNDEYVSGLLLSARDELALIAPNTTLEVIRVPGAFEVPVTVQAAIKHSQPDAVIALGCIIRGATQHADLVAASVTDALQKLAITHGVPIIHEVLLVESHAQAAERCLGTEINRGTEAARVAAQMVSLFQKLRQNPVIS